MIDRTNNKPIQVSTDGDAGPYICVPVEQLDDVKMVLDDFIDGKEPVKYSIDKATIRLDEDPAIAIVNLADPSDAESVQSRLDRAQVLVSMTFVNGGAQDYFETDEIVKKLHRLRDELGMSGKRLFEALFSDDWGAPPRGARIKGYTSEGTPIDEYLPYG